MTKCIQQLIDDGRLFEQSKGPQHFVPEEDRVMLCGSMAMIKDHAADLEQRGFERVVPGLGMQGWAVNQSCRVARMAGGLGVGELGFQSDLKRQNIQRCRLIRHDVSFSWCRAAILSTWSRYSK